MEEKKIIMLLVIGMLVVTAMPTSKADTENIAIKWYIPSDISITIAYPTGLSDVEFWPAGMTFANQTAKDQIAGTSAIKITNSGNVNVNWSINFTSNFPAGVYFFNLTTRFNGYPSSPVLYFWTDSNETHRNYPNASLAPAADHYYYARSCGESVANVTYPLQRTLRIISAAA